MTHNSHTLAIALMPKHYVVVSRSRSFFGISLKPSTSRVPFTSLSQAIAYAEGYRRVSGIRARIVTC